MYFSVIEINSLNTIFSFFTFRTNQTLKCKNLLMVETCANKRAISGQMACIFLNFMY